MKTNHLLQICAATIMLLLASCGPKKHDCKNCPNNVTVPDGTFCYKDEGRQDEMLMYSEVVTMLTDYDKTRVEALKKALGYEDARINTYNFVQFKKYLGHIENLSKKAGIKIAGISFVYASKPNYNNTGKSYQDLIYVPTTMVDNKEVQFDPVQSAKQGKLITFKHMLAEYGYNWKYNKTNDTTAVHKKAMQKDVESGAGNFGTANPPY